MGQSGQQGTQGGQSNKHRQTINQLVIYARELQGHEPLRALGIFRALSGISSNYQAACREEQATLTGQVGDIKQALKMLLEIPQGSSQPIKTEREARLAIKVATFANAIGGKVQLVEDSMRRVQTYLEGFGDAILERQVTEAKIVAALDGGDLVEAAERWQRLVDLTTAQATAATPSDSRQQTPQPTFV